VSTGPHTPDDPQNPPPDATGRRQRGKGTTGRAGAREVAAGHLAAGSTLAAAATAAGIGERTLQRWAAEDAGFDALVQALRRRMVDAALGKLSDGMTRAADVLRELLDHEDATERRLAAGKLIELGLKVKDAAELEQRVRDLEAKLGGQADGGDTRPGEATGGDGQRQADAT